MIRWENFHLQRIFLLFAGLIFIVGCVPEKKLGSEFLNKRRNLTLVIKAPELVKMVNLSYDTLKDISGLSLRQIDSIKFYNSKILQNIKDSTLIGNYIQNLKQCFVNQGYKTIIASAQDTLYDVKGDAFLINVGQIELDEKKIPIRDETQYLRKLYGADYDLSKYELDFWIEVSKIENGIAVEPARMLYDSYELTDDDQGYFQWDDKNSTMNYNLKQDEVQAEEIYSLATFKGSDHAYRLTDYLLNEYIAFFLPQKKDRLLLGVNKTYGTLSQIDEPPFKEIHF